MRGRSLLSTINTQLSTLRAHFTKYGRANSRLRTTFVRIDRWFRFFALGLLLASLSSQAEARKHSTKKAAHREQQSSAQVEAAARLQIFLDRSNFSPGKIDGHYNEFTWKALGLCRQSRGEQPPIPPPGAKGNVAPDINGLDLSGNFHVIGLNRVELMHQLLTSFRTNRTNHRQNNRRLPKIHPRRQCRRL